MGKRPTARHLDTGIGTVEVKDHEHLGSRRTASEHICDGALAEVEQCGACGHTVSVPAPAAPRNPVRRTGPGRR
ncbi:hypothetical protein GCM10028833_11200 [Glycomyces tarimensis]